MAATAWCQETVAWGNITGQILFGKVPAIGALIQVRGTQQQAFTDLSGAFRIPGIPLASWEGDDLDLDISYGIASAHATGLQVLPGALNAPTLRFAFSRIQDTTFDASRSISTDGSTASSSAQPAPAPRATTGSASAIVATREGLVGLTTANGHVIVENDHFAALPSRRALNRTDAASDLEFEVEVANGTKTVQLPVWDVGPWNTKDDWWNTSTFRQSGQDLPRWTPWAQAAFASGYNGGLDQSGRTVKNAAGIDLGDGAFWQDLSMTDNGPVAVRMLWQLDGAPGQRVRAKHWAKVRATPGGTLLDTVLCGTKGTVLAGPDSATISGHWYLFYQVDWDDGTRNGWSAENFLDADTSVACTDAVHPRIRKPSLARIAGNSLIAGAGSPLTEIVILSADGAVISRIGSLAAGQTLRLPASAGVQFISVRSGSARQILTRLP